MLHSLTQFDLPTDDMPIEYAAILTPGMEIPFFPKEQSLGFRIFFLHFV